MTRPSRERFRHAGVRERRNAQDQGANREKDPAMEGSERRSHKEEAGARDFLAPEEERHKETKIEPQKRALGARAPEDYMRRWSFIRPIDASISGRHSGRRSPVSSRKWKRFRIGRARS